LAQAAEALKASQYVSEAQPNVAQGIAKLLQDKKAAADSAAQTGKKLEAAEGTLKDVIRRLADAKYVNLTVPSREALLKGLDAVIADTSAPTITALTEVAKSIGRFGAASGSWLTRDLDLARQLTASEAANARYQAMLVQVQGPKQMVGVWLPVLSQDRVAVQPALLERARRDAQLVADDPSVDAATRNLALYVQGLAVRGQGKYEEARALLARSGGKPAKQALQALTDPHSYYLPEARMALAHGQPNAALALLEQGLAVFPPKTRNGGLLLAERSLANLALAQAQDPGKLNPSNAYAALAAKDAQAALAAGATAEGSYALGRLQEAQGNNAAARDSFEQALAAHRSQDVFGSRVRVALARVLVRLSGGKALALNDGRTPLAPAGNWNPATVLAALLVLTQYEEQEAPPAPELYRAVQLADEAIRAGNAEGFLVKALALAAQQRWTDAVLEYSLGLEKLSGSAEQARTLRYLMENHPSLKIPDGKRPPDGAAAERHFDQGLRHYWERQYAQAEKEFAQAVRSHNQDARFVYFLGLAQLGQERRDQAAESFKKAAQLEQQGKPQPALVSSALERIQGPQRQVLNRYRP
jgi:hypothetical protein